MRVIYIQTVNMSASYSEADSNRGAAGRITSSAFPYKALSMLSSSVRKANRDTDNRSAIPRRNLNMAPISIATFAFSCCINFLRLSDTASTSDGL